MRPAHLLAISSLITALASPALGQCTEELSAPRASLMSVSSGDLAFFAGGLGGDPTPSTRVDVYDDSDGTWRVLELPRPRVFGAATSVDGTVLFGGGRSELFLTEVDLLDIATGTWSTAQLSQPRLLLAAAAANGKALFAGGSEGSLAPSAAVDIYDAATGTWTTSSLSVPRKEPAAASVGTKILVAGGHVTSPSDGSDVVDIYDTVSGTWSTATLSTPRGALAATTVGSVVLFGGGFNAGNRVDLYDDSTGTWSTALLSTPRARLGATSLAGKAYFCGGTVSDRVDVYDAASGLWWWTTLSYAGGGFVTAATGGSKAFYCGGIVPDRPAYSVVDVITPDLPAPFCFGDGSGAACPCGNDASEAAGCVNSTGGGATLRPFGGLCSRNDDLVMAAEGMVPFELVMLFAGEDEVAGGAGAPFGDGLRCAAGNLRRLLAATAGSTGAATFPPGLQELGDFGTGDTRRFQAWYRDPAGPCSAGFNTTNGVEATFAP